MLSKSDTQGINILHNVYKHMQNDYDYLLVVVGDTGTGKSMFALNLMESWYRVILRKPHIPEHVEQISAEYGKWLLQYKKLQAYDMNILDEGSRDLNNLDYMNKVSKDLTVLFETFRCKRFFSVVVLPSYWRLNKNFREDRLRGLVWVDKRGHYKWFTKVGIKYLNGRNDTRRIRSMNLAYPIASNRFPDYDGVVREKYLENKMHGVDQLLDQIISNNIILNKNNTLVQEKLSQVIELRKRGYNFRDIAAEAGISLNTVQRCVKVGLVSGELGS